LDKLAIAGSISAILGFALLAALPVGSIGLYGSFLLLLLGSMLGVAYTLQPKHKPKIEDMGLIIFAEFMACVASMLKYFKMSVENNTTFPFLIAVVPFIPVVAILLIDRYRNRK
jgi:membrane-bound ClpP family serine protease